MLQLLNSFAHYQKALLMRFSLFSGFGFIFYAIHEIGPVLTVFCVHFEQFENLWSIVQAFCLSLENSISSLTLGSFHDASCEEN